MAELSITLKLPFYRLNQAKALEFERLTTVNTQVANDLLKVDKKERKKLTSAAFKHVEIGSMWINQTIRNTNALTIDSTELQISNYCSQAHLTVGDSLIYAALARLT